jgi:general secretion pathway protein K
VKCNLTSSRDRGIALILVMLIVLALGMMAGVFAYSIKLESKLANNTGSEVELEWLGRSGVEMTRWILVQQSRIPRDAGLHALNQFWAGGPGSYDDVDNPFIGLSLRDIPCGEGRFSLTIIDQERKINLNNVDPIVVDRALAMVGGNASDSSVIFNSIKDWTDSDDNPRAGGGTESDYYLTLDPPYLAKNGPMDDITELLKVRGLTPVTVLGRPRAKLRSGYWQRHAIADGAC